MTHSSTVSFSITCFSSFIFLFLSNSKYCYNNFSSRLYFSISSFFIVLSGYFLNIICSTIFLGVPLIYFGSFPILIRVFCYISIFTILRRKKATNKTKILTYIEGLCRGEDAFAIANQSHAKKKATGSSRRMSLRLNEGLRAFQTLIIFYPFKGSFPKNYKFGVL